MLLRFGVANHRSIRDYQEVLLSASKRIKREGLVMGVPTVQEDAVPIVAIFGANASGKSNLIDAISQTRQVIVRSHRELGATQSIPREPFLLDDTGTGKPTKFDCTFTMNRRGKHPGDDDPSESVYEYGFEYIDAEFRNEWLLRVVRRERQSTRTLFERETKDGQVRVSFGSRLRGENRTIANLTRPNSLFLSAAAQNNHPQLTDVYRHFLENWRVVLSEEPMDDDVVAKRLKNYEHMARLLSLVRQADIGISDVDIEDAKVDGKHLNLARDLAGVYSRHFAANDEDGSLAEKEVLELMRGRKRMRFMHEAAGGDKKALEYRTESKGTRTLISLLIPALEALSSGSLLAIDELDTSLHPRLARAFVSLFSNKRSNPHGAQLVFSTHDVSLLGSGLIHQDQIWVADKSREGVSEFTPLTDYKLRSRDDIERAYRFGRLGGVPTSDDFFVDFVEDEVPAKS